MLRPDQRPVPWDAIFLQFWSLGNGAYFPLRHRRGGKCRLPLSLSDWSKRREGRPTWANSRAQQYAKFPSRFRIQMFHRSD